MERTKLVRDKIPESDSKDYPGQTFRTATPDEYRAKLKEKLVEETIEFLESENPEELADVLEVVYALAALKKISLEELEKLRKEKLGRRGGFSKKVILIQK